MKKLILSFLTLMVAFGTFAQDEATAQAATDELVEIFGLDAEQAQKMLVIQERKVRNVNQIQTMKSTDVKKFRHKSRAIQQSTDASIRRMLTKEQMVIYQQRRLEWRENRATRMSELKQSGLTKEQIEDTLLEEGF